MAHARPSLTTDVYTGVSTEGCLKTAFNEAINAAIDDAKKGNITLPFNWQLAFVVGRIEDPADNELRYVAVGITELTTPVSILRSASRKPAAKKKRAGKS